MLSDSLKKDQLKGDWIYSVNMSKSCNIKKLPSFWLTVSPPKIPLLQRWTCVEAILFHFAKKTIECPKEKLRKNLQTDES